MSRWESLDYLAEAAKKEFACEECRRVKKRHSDGEEAALAERILTRKFLDRLFSSCSFALWGLIWCFHTANEWVFAAAS